jgi:hypothetical protein
VHLAAITAGQSLNVLDNRALLLLSAVQVEKPIRGAVVPKKIVSPQGDVVLESEARDRVGGAEIFLSRRASVHDLPFHFVLGNHETGFLQYEVDKWPIVGDLLCGDRRSVKEPLLGGQLAQCHRLCRPAAPRG